MLLAQALIITLAIGLLAAPLAADAQQPAKVPSRFIPSMLFPALKTCRNVL